MYVDHFDFDLPLLWTVEGALTPEECETLLHQAERGTWLDATVNSAEGRVVQSHIRNNTLVVLDVPEWAAVLEARLEPHLPKVYKGGQWVCVGPKMRCYRYTAGQHFGLHRDQFYQGPMHHGHPLISRLTLMVYLNDDFDGGETDFPEQSQVVVPRQGSALLFQHMLLHEGKQVDRGTKYVLRTDVFYTSV
ncbi:MAG: 2OG-Fe(II) oxygenase [Myxococcota bacterium]